MCAGDSTGKYAGVLDCFVKTARNDGLLVRKAAAALVGLAVCCGPASVSRCVCVLTNSVVALPQAFYNGFMPNFARLGSWNVAMFLMLEQVSWRFRQSVCSKLPCLAAACLLSVLLCCAATCPLQMKVVLAPKS
jgi:hypothetical protein